MSTNHAALLRCLHLAWQGLRSATLPIGAVVTDGEGRVVCEGRGRLLEPDGPPGQLADCHVAHAEINALAGLSARRSYGGYTLYTSLEPCLMCVGAAATARIGTLVYLGADPYAGAAHLYRPTPYLAEQELRIHGPDHGGLGRLAMAMHCAFYVRHDPDAPALRLHRQREPAAAQLAEPVANLLQRRNTRADTADLLTLVNRTAG